MVHGFMYWTIKAIVPNAFVHFFLQVCMFC